MKTPTDLKMLNEIYNDYYDDFIAFEKDESISSTKIYIPIDISKIAQKFDVDIDIIFGRLYYHLEKKYGYKDEDNAHVHFFSIRVGGDKHCINFPYLSSVVAALRDENRKYRLATGMAIVSFIVSIISFLLSLDIL